MKHFLRENKAIIIVYSMVAIIGVTAYFLFMKFEELKSGIRFIISIFTPFIIGYIIAYLLNPTMTFIENKFLFSMKIKTPKIKRYISLSLTYVLTILVITLLTISLAPQIRNSILMLFDNIPSYIVNFRYFIDNALDNFNISAEFLNQALTFDALFSYATKIFNTSFGWVINIPVILTNGFTNLLVGIIISIYFLLDKEKFVGQVRKVIIAFYKEDTADNIIGVAKITNSIFTKFIVGKIIDSAIIGLIAFPFMLIIYAPYALLISVIIGITNVIPFFGPFIGAIPSGIIILIAAPDKLIWFVIFIFVLQQFDGNILGPKILGDSIGMPPIWVMLGIFVGGSLLGFLGMIIGVPVTAVLYFLLKTNVNEKYKMRMSESEQLTLKKVTPNGGK